MSSGLPESLQAPETARHLRFRRYQWVGLPLLFLVPVLALFGVFGESWDRVERAGPDLGVEVQYADRYRYKQTNAVEVWVENRAGVALDTVVVTFDEAYMRQFSAVAFIPAPTGPFEVELYAVRPGERRLVWAELKAVEYGRHAGSLRAYTLGRPDTVAVDLSTFIFP